MLLPFINSVTLLLMLLNPFLMIVYLLDLMEDLSSKQFKKILLRASLISVIVFIIFGLVGDAIFRRVLHARFASFQIFGGIIFLIIGIRFVFRGPEAMKRLRGKPEHVAGAIAMPIMVGPSTISASIIVGQQLAAPLATLAIVLSVFLSTLVIMILKRLHDFVRPRNEALIERYVEIMGRVTALIVGTFSIEMIMQGLKSWISYAMLSY